MQKMISKISNEGAALKKAIISCLLFAFALALPSIAGANPDWPVTSPFGWRTHPIFGTQKFHNGIDFGVDEGTPIPAASAGVVSYAGWIEGYGYTVIIDHPNGGETLYAHQSQLNCYTGQHVSGGLVIGYVGSTGWSTGPHLHLGYKLNGEWVDPAPLLAANGWGITVTGGGSYGILDDLLGYEGFNEAPFNFDEYYNLGASMSAIMLTFVNACKDGLTALQNELFTLLVLLAIIDFTLYMYMKGFSPKWVEIIGRIIRYGFIMFCFVNWQDLVNNFFLSFFVDNTTTLTGDASFVSQNMSQPELLTQKGVFLIKPVFTYYSSLHGLSFLGSLFGALLALCIGLLILLAFIAMSLQIVVYYLEFYLMAMFGVFSLVFSVLFPTKFVAEGGIGALIGSGIKLMAASVLTAIMVTALKPIQPENYELTIYIHILFVVLAFAFMLFKLPKNIVNLLGGNARF